MYLKFMSDDSCLSIIHFNLKLSEHLIIFWTIYIFYLFLYFFYLMIIFNLSQYISMIQLVIKELIK